jgi:hypothetical protein
MVEIWLHYERANKSSYEMKEKTIVCPVQCKHQTWEIITTYQGNFTHPILTI